MLKRLMPHALITLLLLVPSLYFSAMAQSITALYQVEKIVKIVKKQDEKCIDNPTQPCPRNAYWKVYYKAFDSGVKVQEHIVNFEDNVPQLGVIVQLTIEMVDEK